MDPCHGFVSWIRVMDSYNGFVSWIRIMGIPFEKECFASGFASGFVSKVRNRTHCRIRIDELNGTVRVYLLG